MNLFIFKLIVTPALIGGVSLAGRRWGPVVSGLLIGLPLSSGPVALFLALDQGVRFAAVASIGIMLGTISVALFALCYSWLAFRWSWLPTILVSWLLFLACTWAFEGVSLPAVPLYLALALVLAAVLRLLPVAPGKAQASAAPWWDIPGRMLAATAFVLLITGLAPLLGPHLSGLLAPFPVFATVLATFTHRLNGPAAASRLLRGLVLGLYSFGAFFLVLALLIQRAGILVTFLAASAVTLALQAALLWLLSRRQVAG
jgi:hypothetical protein